MQAEAQYRPAFQERLDCVAAELGELAACRLAAEDHRVSDREVALVGLWAVLKSELEETHEPGRYNR